jgi:hypothetical protein
VYPVFPLVLLGISYSVYASALWPSVALLIEPSYHATAYGVVTAVQNLGLAAIPIGELRSRFLAGPRSFPRLSHAPSPLAGVGKLMPSPKCPTYDDCVSHYTRVEMLLIGFGAVGFLSSLALALLDLSSKVPVLHWTAAKVAARKQKVLEDAMLSSTNFEAE